MKINFEGIIRNLESKANSIYRDNEKLRNLIIKVKDKIDNNKELREIFEEIKLLIELIRDWLKGDYKELSQTSVVLVIISFIYLLNPFDLIPDFIAGGFVDDIAVITYIVKKIQEELKAYKRWRNREETAEIIEIQGDVMDIDE
ncbi:MAG: DUF1232 domain-containing protein [Tissierellia bacterium]|nr:DUF1232 domain-containing protein [Tissierellia bacterium]